MATPNRNFDGPSGGARALIFLALAIVAGGAATTSLFLVLQSYEEQIAIHSQPEEMVAVILASGDLYPGIMITENDIAQINVPKKYVPADAFTSPEMVVGRIPRERILGNEFILPARLANGEEGIGLNALVPSGMRALSLNLTDGGSVAGFLAPGNKVDLLVTLTSQEPGHEQDRETLTLMQNVPVIAVNSRMNQGEEVAKEGEKKPQKRAGVSRPSVTLALTPEQAEITTHAGRLGPITLALRGGNDKAEVLDKDPVTTPMLLGMKPEVVKKPAPRKARPMPAGPLTTDTVIKIIRGDIVVDYSVPSGRLPQ